MRKRSGGGLQHCTSLEVAPAALSTVWWRRELDEHEEKRRKKQQLRLEMERMHNREKQRVDTLAADATAWQESNRIRRYIQEARHGWTQTKLFDSFKPNKVRFLKNHTRPRNGNNFADGLESWSRKCQTVLNKWLEQNRKQNTT